MKKSILPIALMIVIVLLFNACEKALHCIDGNGNLVSENRGSVPFNRMMLEGAFDIYVIQDDYTKLEVEAESNLMPFIETHVVNNRLEIGFEDDRCIDNNYPIRIKVRTPDLNSISLSGSGDIVMNNFNSESMKIEIIGSGDVEAGLQVNSLEVGITGSGDVRLWGSADIGEYSISGSGSIQAYEMILNECYARISGSGSMFVYATDFLDVVISGSGSVYYDGNPELSTSISGSGSVIHR